MSTKSTGQVIDDNTVTDVAVGPAIVVLDGDATIRRNSISDVPNGSGIEVVQLTTESDVPGSHLYMEAQVFTSDSRRFVLHRSATAHGGDRPSPAIPPGATWRRSWPTRKNKLTTR